MKEQTLFDVVSQNIIVGGGAVGGVEPDAHSTCSSGSFHVNLPPNFTARIQLLPANTLQHVPSNCRLRIDDHSQLEEGRSKLKAPLVSCSLPAWERQPRCQNASRFGRSTASRTCCGGPASLCGDLADHSCWQATTGGSCSGLGLRTVLGAALHAFVESHIRCSHLGPHHD